MKILYICLVLLSTLPALSASLITVSVDGGMDFSTIGSAIEAASEGDSILVYPGVYVENVDFIGKTITLCSLEALTGDRSYVQSTIIDGNRTGSCVAFLNGEQNATLRGFTLRNGIGTILHSDALFGGGIAMLHSGRVNLTNCDITNNKSISGAGIYCGSGPLYMSGVNIFENYGSWGGSGLIIFGHLDQTSMVYFDPDNLCSVYSNYGSAPVDIFIVDLRRNLDIHLDMGTIDHSDEFYISRLMNIPQYDHYTDTVNIQQGYRSEVNHDLYVSPDGDDAYSGLSPDQAMKTITKAIHRIAGDSLNVKTVHVSPGTYREGAEGQILPLPLKRNVNVIGAGAEQTIIIADSDLPPMMQTIVVGRTAKNTIFKGFTLLSDNAELNQPLWLVSRTSNVRISDIVIRDMNVTGFGPLLGAISTMDWVNSEMDSIRIENVTTDQAVFYMMNVESGTIKNSRFENIISLYSDLDPWGGHSMISIPVSGSITMENCIFRDLESMGNQTVFHISKRDTYSDGVIDANINNCLFTGIRTKGTRAILLATNNHGTYKVSNCTFYDNYATLAPIGIIGHVTMRNNVFYNPDAQKEIHVYHVNPIYMFYSKLDFDYNLIRGGYSSISKPGILSILEWGEHNLSQEPAFASIDYTDPNFLHLSGDSPAVDTGTPDISELGLPPYDLAGNLRVWNNRIDLGCFEYGSEPWVFNDDPVAPSLPETGIIAYPNPFNALTNIKIGLMNHTSKGNINVASVKVYNLKGQLIKSIPLDPARIDEQIVPWDGRDAQNHYCANGIYFLKLQINGKNRGSKKITYIK
ncbi:MAG: DUF1565 domain-containing protein [Candidatus Cloacimonadaceae bacterium]